MSSTIEKLVFKVHINGSIQDVWNEITKTNEPQGAMFNMQLHTEGLAPGAAIRMRTRSGKYTGVVGEVTAFEPPHRYAHTFQFTQYDDPPCTVTYLLREVDGGTEFTLECENVPAGSRTAKDMQKGGQMIVDTLKAIVETGRPSLLTRMFYVMFRVLEPMSPKKTLTVNWP